KEPNPSQVAELVSILRPNFDYYESANARITQRAEELKRYTNEQYDALDAMEQHNQVIFSGPAGTGKTLLALELARRRASVGKSVLLLCFNRLLGHWLEEETFPIKQVTASTIHSQMLAIANIDVESKDPDFW